MGWNTYHQIVTELSPSEWVYDNFTTYVFTHRKDATSSGCANPFSDNIRFVSMNPIELIKELRKQSGKDIWVCGGASVVQQLVAANLIDLYYITVIPVLLGSGIRLFDGGEQEIKLHLQNTRSYNGMTDLVYTRR